MGREVGGGNGMGKTCKLKDVSFQCMTKFTTKKKKKKNSKHGKKKKKITSKYIKIFKILIKLISCNLIKLMLMIFLYTHLSILSISL